MRRAISRCSAETAGEAVQTVMPCPIWAGVFGMERTTLAWPRAVADQLDRRAGDNGEHQGLRAGWRPLQSGQDVAQPLGLDR
jgi:hypothetical protein